MSAMKDIMMKGMQKIMLDCERASLLATKSDFEKLNCVRRTQIKMHLATCKFCRAFAEQSKLISQQLEVMKEIDADNLQLHLTGPQKESLQAVVDTGLKNS
jgi:hypothetical protein